MIQDRTEALLCASLCLQRGVKGVPIAGIRPWILAACVEVTVLPPPSVIADVARVLLDEVDDVYRAASTGYAELDRALNAYAEHVLGRLLTDRHIRGVRDAIAGLPARTRPTAVVVALEMMLGRLDLGAPSPTHGPLRRLIRRADAELHTWGRDALDDSTVRSALVIAYRDLADKVRRQPTLLIEADSVTLENLDALGGSAQRLALHQIAEVATELKHRLPRRIRSRKRLGVVNTNIQDESSYPVGGYASIGTQGGLESLVSTELIYMESERSRVDLFDVRWATNELLKYTRDESVFTRISRRIVMVFDQDLVQARIQDPGSEYQRIVLALGAIVAGVQRLIEWLDRVELQIELWFEKPGISEECALVGLLLRAEQDVGVVKVKTLGRKEIMTELEGVLDVLWLSDHSSAGQGIGVRLDEEVDWAECLAEFV